MPTIQEGPPTAAEPAATASDGSAPAPLVMNATEIVNAAINNSANVHLGTISNATTTAETAELSIPSQLFLDYINYLGTISNATTTAETAELSITLNSASTDGGEASASTEPTQLSKEAKKAEAERRRKLRQDEKNVQQQRQLDEMKRLPLEAIQLTPDGNDVLKIGSVVWDDVGLNYRLDYLKAKNIKYGRNRSKDALGPLIVNFLKAQPYKNVLRLSSYK
ncbi:hypothetical protein ACHAWO_008617 [Cyclotella atomus]|uniref:Uncharacterized protein n=1 Tax=Cyclotella atomus TaxID=382360 RepID=A0ABD3MZP1_9STRA